MFLQIFYIYFIITDDFINSVFYIRVFSISALSLYPSFEHIIEEAEQREQR